MSGLLLLAGFLLSPASSQHKESENQTHELCSGFIPENDMNIPINKSGLGMSEAEFNDVIDKIEKLYRPDVEAMGDRLVVNRDWKSGTVNASASKSGKTRTLNFFGGLARHPEIKKDGFTLVACHEMGHHLGGIPKVRNLFSTWAANEGQSDYFATLKCLRRFYETFDQDRLIDLADEHAKQECLKTYTTTAEQQICFKLMTAGQEVSFFFQKARKEERVPKYNEPDSTVVGSTVDSHPATQCRMDTYFQGALCPRQWQDPVSDKDAFAGACHPDSFANGVRPRCWYKY